MKKLYFLFISILFASLSIPAFAQLDCSDGRYYNRTYFTQWDSTENILFGSGPAVGSGTQELKMTVFQPSGDQLAKRPLVILTFGGSFVTGQRSDVYDLCLAFVKMGYVAVATDYRVGFFYPINQISTTKAVVRGMHDMKAAVRYFYKDAQTDNLFKIDTNYIIVGGVSAGAICALHTAYLTEDSEIPSYLANDTAGMGGVEGLSGNQGYSSRVAGVIDFSGTLGDTAWIKPGDAPIVGLHDLADNTVPYGTGLINVSGMSTGLTANGTGTIMTKTDILGIPNALKTYPGTGHVSYLQSTQQKWDEAIDFVKVFIADLVCGNAELSVQDNVGQNQLKVYPNPANGTFSVSFVNTSKETFHCTITDVMGRVVNTFSTNSDKAIIDGTTIPAGIYSIAFTNGNQRWSQKVVLN